MDNRIIVDWLSFTYRSAKNDPRFFIDLISPDSPWQEIKGMYGYKKRWYCNGISIHYAGSADQGVWVEMSGQGCRYFEKVGASDWDELLRLVVSDYDFNVTRLDIAYDDFVGKIDIKRLCHDLDPDNLFCTSKWKTFQVIKSTGKTDTARTVICGSQRSDFYFRVYDKKQEQEDDTIPHWIRAEFQLRDERASEFLNELVRRDYDVGEMYAGVLKNYLTIREPTNDTNKSRWPVALYWEEFVSDAEKINIVSYGDDYYDEDKLRKFVMNQAGHATQTYIKLHGAAKFVESILERPFRPNPKYEALLNAQRLMEHV